MHPRADELIRELRLEKHPEGGHFSEVFRSPRLVRAHEPGGVALRSALTTILFLLGEGEVSRWHRLDADEIWHHYEGAPLDLFLLGAADGALTRVTLGPAASGTVPVHVVPAGAWVAARPAGAFALVGCTMGPGYETTGLTLMKDVPDVAVDVLRRFPEAAELL